MKRQLLLCFLTFSLLAWGQDAPKLGLVLSGGGAKGLAHVGVLKAMEEAGLKPDFIAGTSMGSIVGGLYAIGYSASEIDSIMRAIDWDAVLSNKMPLNYIAFEEKEYYDRYLVEFPFVNYKLKVGTGLIRGQRLNELMHLFFWPALQYDNFDQFPIPFRCVATNVGTGKSQVFKSGSLPTALRASMAIPTAFTAVEQDSTLLVDGGVLNNFPVELAEEWGVDYIIGVNTGAKLNRDLPESMPEILMTLSMIPANEKLQEQAQKCDIYIQPKLDKYGAASFGDASEILAIGDSAGQQFLTKMRQLAAKIGAPRKAAKMGTVEKAITIDSIYLTGNHLFSDELILKKLGIASGQTVLRHDLLQGLRRVYGINGFKSIDYEIRKDLNGQNGLYLRMLEKEANYFYASLHADNIFSSGLNLNFTARELLGRESRSIFALDISRNPRFRFDYYKYLQSYKRWAFNFRYDYGALQTPSYRDGELRNILISFSHRAHALFMTTQSLKESYAAGAFYENSRSRIRIGADIPDGLESSIQENYGFRLMHTANDLDNRNFPQKGGEAIAVINTYLGTTQTIRLEDGVDSLMLGGETLSGVSRFMNAEELSALAAALNPGVYVDALISARYFRGSAKNWQWVPFYAVGLSLGGGESNSVVNAFRLGGLQRLQQNDVRVLGLQFGEVVTANFALGGLMIQQVLWDDLFIRYGLNVLSYHPYRSLQGWGSLLTNGDYDELERIAGIGLEASWRTFLGPISAGISTNSGDWQPRYYLGLGFSFNYSD